MIIDSIITMLKKITWLMLFVVILSMAPINNILAFDANNIINDQDITDYKAMTLGEIQRFLENKTGILDLYITEDRDGNLRTAAEIIYLAAVNNRVNPRFLLVLLQKEQSLVEDSTPKQGQFDWATGYAACDNCDVSHPNIVRFKGFPKQINSAAAQIRYYIDNPTEFHFKMNETYTIDNSRVTPGNHATAALYNYTPHISGNQNFWKIWNRWFGKTFPDGSLLQALDNDEEVIYLIKDGKRRKFASRSAFTSRYKEDKIQFVSITDILQYDEGLPIQFPQYSIFQNPDGTVYLLRDDKIHGITSQDVFRKIGFNPDEIIQLSWDEIKMYEEGPTITADNTYPTGALLQDKNTGGVFYVIDGKKHPIWAKEILIANFANKKIIPVDTADLDRFTTANPLLLNDGELIITPGDPAVYVISNQEKHPFKSAETFEKLGYKWGNIITVPKKVLDLHPTGDMVQLIK